MRSIGRIFGQPAAFIDSLTVKWSRCPQKNRFRLPSLTSVEVVKVLDDG
jgi:hypothetical protein